MEYYLGIDIGTSACKSVIFDSFGKQVSESYREYDLVSPRPGWAELNPDEVIDKCFDVIRESVSGLKECRNLGIGISSQGEAFTLLDASGNSLCNALVSSDTRAGELVSEWACKLGEKEIYQITGHTPYTMYSLFKLLWIKQHLPRTWSSAERILCFEDLLQYRLGIRDPGMGWSLAGRTMLFDVREHKWSKTILEATGIPEQMLSRTLPSGSVVGTIPDTMCRSLGLPKETYVVTGGHDQVCAALGAGAILPGMSVYAAGSVECITPAFDRAVFSDELRKNNLCTYDHAVPGMYATVAFSLTGGNLLKWFRDVFGEKEVHLAREQKRNPYELLLEQLPEGQTDLLVLPYFTSSGTPYFDLSVKGTLLGLELGTTRFEILKALLEGVSLEIRLNLDILERSGYRVTEFRAIGGGAKSAVHNQLKADVLGRPISIMNVSEGGCLGTALLARCAKSGEPLQSVIQSWVRTVARVEPREENNYAVKYERYKKLYPVLKDLYCRHR